MNELLDEDVIARLRSALDEVSAETHGLVAAEAPRPRMSAARWMAVAAAVVLIVGATAVLVIHRNEAPDSASSPTEVATTAAVSTDATEPTLIRVETPRYTLIAEDLVPSPDASLPNLLAGETSMVWALGGNPVDGLFILRSGPGSPNMAPADTSLAAYQMIGDQAVAASSYGLDLQQQDALLAQVQPGSGLPWVLPVDDWTYLGLGTGNDGPTFEQIYSSEGGTVVINVGPLANQFLTLAAVGSIEQTTIVSRKGWKATSDEDAYVLWPAGDSGQWASMKISASLVDRADALIAGVIQVSEEAANEPTVDTVLAPTVDTAVAETTPTPSDPTASTPTASIPAPSEPIGRLTIPALDFDWIVVNTGSGVSLKETAKVGPVLVAGPLPGQGADGETSIIWGNRTTYGAPFENIDELVVGDIIQWIGADGTESTFEVIGSTVGMNAEIPDGASLQLHTYAPKYTSNVPLVVYARRTA